MKKFLLLLLFAVFFSCEMEQECVVCTDTYLYRIIFPQEIYDTTYIVCPEREGVYLLEYKSEINMDEEDFKSLVPIFEDSVFYLDGIFIRRRNCIYQ